jgi:hypothetical protein
MVAEKRRIRLAYYRKRKLLRRIIADKAIKSKNK